jgi:hypothetical protein
MSGAGLLLGPPQQLCWCVLAALLLLLVLLPLCWNHQWSAVGTCLEEAASTVPTPAL